MKHIKEIMDERGIPAGELLRELKNGLDRSKEIYWLRMMGLTDEWSSTTRCKGCGEYWCWGVQENLDYTCDKCN